MPLLVAEIGLMVIGFVALVSGKFRLTRSRVVRGAPARWLGVLAIAPIPLVFLGGLAFGVFALQEGVNVDLTNGSTRLIATMIEGLLFLICLGAVYGIGWPLSSEEFAIPDRGLTDADFDPPMVKGLVKDFTPLA